MNASTTTQSAWLTKSIEQFRLLKSRFKGQTFLVLGNGPSLNSVERRQLDGCVSIGTNNSWRMASRWGRDTDILVIADKHRLGEFEEAKPATQSVLVVGNHDDVLPSPTSCPYARSLGALCLKQLVIPYFRRSPRLLALVRRQTKLFSRVAEKQYPSFDFEAGFNFGYSVVIPAIQLATSLGASRILLCGVDATAAKGAYFAGMPSNVRTDAQFLQNPRLTMEPHLALLRAALDPMKIPLLDCSPGGALTSLLKGELDAELETRCYA